jgi:hypothetical protein
LRTASFLLGVAIFSIPEHASASNIPGHMLSGIIAYQVLQQENTATIDKVTATLKKILGTQTNDR